ncbi:MAG: hypothetical protein RIQ52_1546 [Pseudomonadota bacterium]|jgi:hypothetical protein
MNASIYPMAQSNSMPASLAQCIRTYLSDVEWSHEESARKNWIRFKARIMLDHATVTTMIRCQEETRQLSVYTHAPLYIPAEVCQEILAFVTRANYRTPARIEFDPNQGRIKFCVDAALPDSDPSLSFIGQMVQLNHDALDCFMPGILRICFGGISASEAWSEIGT